MTQPSEGPVAARRLVHGPLSGLVARVRETTDGYPRQFWLLFWGQLVSSTGSAMIWPFMTIYMHERLDASMALIGVLFALNSAAGFPGTAIAGPIADRLGRRGVMVAGLLSNCAMMAGMATVHSLGLWVPLMIASGLFSPLFGIGSNAMIADLMPPERRAGAYALLRIVNNVGVAVGPSVGGFIILTSYGLAFGFAAIADLVFAVLIFLFARETRPREQPKPEEAAPRSTGYGPVLRDRPFLAFVLCYLLVALTWAFVVLMLPVYAKEQFGIPENQYGFIMATNAVMVILFQYVVTQVTRKHAHVPVLAVGALFYGVGVGAIALGRSFPAFAGAVAVATIGELIMSPTATTLTADLAPADMRGRYMGVFNIAWGVSFGLGPLLGGLLNDHIAPVSVWYAGLALGLLSALGFALLARRLRKVRPALAATNVPSTGSEV